MGNECLPEVCTMPRQSQINDNKNIVVAYALLEYYTTVLPYKNMANQFFIQTLPTGYHTYFVEVHRQKGFLRFIIRKLSS